MNRKELINTSRKPWLDALRGLAILLVVYGHQVRFMTDYFVFTSPIKMPLFFAITGYVFSVNGGGCKFVNQFIMKIIIPWLALGMIPQLIYIPFYGFGRFFNYLLELLSGKVLWFMPCFAIAYVFQYLIRRFCKNTLLNVVVSFACFALGLVLSHYHILDYAMFNRALTVQPFFLIGIIFKQYEEKLKSIKWRWIILLFVVYIGLCFLGRVLFPGQIIDVHNNKYFNIPLCLLLIFLGCLLFFIAGSKSDFSSWIMSFLGQNTLVIYCWHYSAIMVLVMGLSFLGWDMPATWWSAMIKVIWTCIICGVLAALLNRYLPVLVGKKRKI